MFFPNSILLIVRHNRQVDFNDDLSSSVPSIRSLSWRLKKMSIILRLNRKILSYDRNRRIDVTGKISGALHVITYKSSFYIALLGSRAFSQCTRCRETNNLFTSERHLRTNVYVQLTRYANIHNVETKLRWNYGRIEFTLHIKMRISFFVSIKIVNCSKIFPSGAFVFFQFSFVLVSNAQLAFIRTFRTMIKL